MKNRILTNQTCFANHGKLFAKPHESLPNCMIICRPMEILHHNCFAKHDNLFPKRSKCFRGHGTVVVQSKQDLALAYITCAADDLSSLRDSWHLLEQLDGGGSGAGSSVVTAHKQRNFMVGICNLHSLKVPSTVYLV